MKAGAVITALTTVRYERKAWACLREVGDATGYAGKRHVDLVAIGLWPSSGLEIHGVEVKVSKSDWRSEVRDPAKAEEGFRRFCDRWYVAAPQGTVATAELPPGWGLLEVHGAKVTTTRESDKLSPEPIGRLQVAAIARRLVEQMAPSAVLEAARKSGAEDAREAAEKVARMKFERTHEALLALRKNVKAFELASGVDLASAWSYENIGKVVRDVLDGRAHRALNTARSELKNLLDRIDTILESEGAT